MKLKNASRPPGFLVVTLPKLDSVPAEYRGKPYKVASLLGDGDANAKLARSNGAGEGYKTFGLSLAPAHTSGHQACPASTPACRAVCLFYQGRANWPQNRAARIAKTIAFFRHRAWFADRLRADVDAAVRSCARLGVSPAVRLNVTSDLPWESLFPWLFEDYPGIRFYDYTKVHNRAMKRAGGDWPSNYHLTFSRAENNEAECLEVLKAGGNVAVVFGGRPLPPAWRGYPVVDGDETDLRFLDPPGSAVGLGAKGTGKGDDTGFVVRRTPLQLTSP